MAVTLTTFNLNNFLLRYKFGNRFPDDMFAESRSTDPRWGYLPLYKPGPFEPARVGLGMGDDDPAPLRVDLRFARLRAVTKDLSASDHCPSRFAYPSSSRMPT